MSLSRPPSGISCPNCGRRIQSAVDGSDHPALQPDRLKGATLSCENCETDLTVFYY
ncbi:MAG: hypothetical protein ABEI96_05050 [Haloarculaceae archaeon]